PRARTVIEIFADWVLHAQLATFLQQQDRSGGELFGNRTQTEFGFRSVWNIQLDVRKAVALTEYHLAIARNERGAGEALFGRGAKILVELRCDRRGFLRQRGDGGEYRQGGQNSQTDSDCFSLVHGLPPMDGRRSGLFAEGFIKKPIGKQLGRRPGRRRSGPFAARHFLKEAGGDQGGSDVNDPLQQTPAAVAVLGDLLIEAAVAEAESSAPKQQLHDDLAHGIERQSREHHQAEITEAMSVAGEIARYRVPGHDSYRDDQSRAAERRRDVVRFDRFGVIIRGERAKDVRENDQRNNA